MRKAIQGLVAATALAVAGPVLAQQPSPYETSSSGPSTPSINDIGEDLTAGGRLEINSAAEVDYIDNYLNQHDGKSTGWGPVLKPGAEYTYALPRFRFIAGASGDIGWINVDDNGHGMSATNNYADSKYGVGSTWVAANNHSFSFAGEMQFSHDPFGTARTEGTPGIDSDLDKWRREAFDAKYLYGSAKTPLSVEFKIGTSEIDYTTNRFFTKYLDYEREGLEAVLYYSLTSKTTALFDVIGARTRYPDVFPGAFDRASNELRYRAGLRWLATSKTTGDIRIGLVERTHPDPRLRSFSGFDWQVAVSWDPRSYTTFSLQTGRHSQESYVNTADFIDNRYVQAEWSYDWTALFNTRVAVTYVNAEFVGTSRTDDFYTGQVQLSYRLTPYLSIYGGGNYNSRGSSDPAREYDQYSVSAGVRFVR
jgi:hypothetical protein